MNIFVTGGAGFIGSAYIRYIIKETDHSILNIDTLSYSGNLDSLKSISDSKRYKFIQADICNSKIVKKLIHEFQPNIIVNFAAESHVDRSIEDPLSFINTNILGTFNLLDASLEFWNSFGKNFLFHHISTDEVYGDIGKKNFLFTEDSKYDPSSPYSASKASSDHLVRAWQRTYNLPTLITNCSNNFGPFQFPEKLIPYCIISCLRGNEIPVYGDGSQIRDWLYVDDHVMALHELQKSNFYNETFNIGGNNTIKNIEVVKSICNILDKKIKDKKIKTNTFHSLIKYTNDRPGHDIKYAVDNSKIKQAVGWSPSKTFNDHLEDTVDWYITNKSWWSKIIDGSYDMKRIGFIDEK